MSPTMTNKSPERPQHIDNGTTTSGQHVGSLAIVATPIGALDDFSKRAVETLQSVDVIYCEDTRTFGKLAQRFNIARPLRSYHEHNERARLSEAEKLLLEGKRLALVSDAGTPLVSDPGYHLVNCAHSLGARVLSIPGPCAAIAALSVSGFEPHRFIFEGFLPVKKGKRSQMLKESLRSRATVIFYESPHRLLSTLALLSEMCPSLEVCVARELTKLHEEVIRGTATEVYTLFEKRQSIKGEIVLLLRAARASVLDLHEDTSPS